jgi:Amt family ammonium transporter
MAEVVFIVLVLAGAIGWSWTNPLQATAVSDLALLRGAVNSILFASGGVLVPLLYTWFVTGKSDPLFSARGLVAGVVAGLAAGPFVQPGVAFAIGLIAGATVPFVNFIMDGVLRIDDATGVVTANGVPALIGLILVGLFADGVVGSGWQLTGLDTYLGVTGQGVSGLFVARGFQVDFPGQLQAQVIGVLALGLWGLITGVAICTPLGLLLHGLHLGENRQPPIATTPIGTQMQMLEEDGFDLAEFEEDFLPAPTSERPQPLRKP